MNTFPDDFIWGASTSAHQTEGGNVGSDWWLLEHAEGSPAAEPSGDACDSFHRYTEDIGLHASNASGDARSLARMYAVLAMGGELDGVRLASPETIELFRTPSSNGPVALAPDWLPGRSRRQHMAYALGFEGDFTAPLESRRFGPTTETFGHLGMGGQIGFADPVRGVSVGFVRNHLADWSVSNDLVSALYACL